MVKIADSGFYGDIYLLNCLYFSTEVTCAILQVTYVVIAFRLASVMTVSDELCHVSFHLLAFSVNSI